jgi:hypothetical protein
MLSFGLIKDINISQTLMNILPNLLEKQCLIRLNEN